MKGPFVGNPNELKFIESHRDLFTGPYLEVGSHDYGSTQNIRSLIGSTDYVGVDMIEGQGVDIALDLTGPFEGIDAALKGQRFGSIFCLCVLEHCAQPFAMGENLTRLLAPGGRIMISVPFAWKFHGYPSDYWRFTHEGIKKLFPRLNFDADRGMLYHPPLGMTMPIDEELGRVALSSREQSKAGRPISGAFMTLLKAMGPLNPLRYIMKVRYLMLPTCIVMVGEAGADQDGLRA